jgi:hypothetical protein
MKITQSCRIVVLQKRIALSELAGCSPLVNAPDPAMAGKHMVHILVTIRDSVPLAIREN